MVSPNCLAGCISRYQGGCQLKLPPEGNSLAPWIKVEFSNFVTNARGNVITVGNQSSPSTPHTAVIKSFELGLSTGAQCKLLIHDEQGGSFVQFVDTLLKDAKTMGPNTINMKIEFGWVNALCPNGVPIVKSPPFYLTAVNNETSFEEGKIKYEISGSDQGASHIMGQTRNDKVLGTSDKKIPLTEAIRRLFSEQPPPIVPKIEFLKANSNKPFEWELGGIKGPLGHWQSNNLNKLSTAIDWVSRYRTKDGKGVKATWDNRDPSGKIIFWEDHFPICGEFQPIDEFCKGFYIVNGGACSSVLKFNPKMSWQFQQLNNSGGSQSNTVASVKKEGRNECQDLKIKGVGTQNTINSNENVEDLVGSKEAIDHISKAQTASEFANPSLSTTAINAELQVVGDPLLSGNLDIMGKTVAIVVINPFHITPIGGCGDWLARPGCNEVLSNKAWRIMGAHHHMAEGNFVTTLNLSLPAPGSLLNLDEPFGGRGSEGYTIKR